MLISEATLGNRDRDQRSCDATRGIRVKSRFSKLLLGTHSFIRQGITQTLDLRAERKSFRHTPDIRPMPPFQHSISDVTSLL